MPKEILLTSAIPALPEQYGWKTAWFDLPGLRMHAATAGPEHGPLVLLLHGFPEFWFSFRKQINDLARAGFRVVAPDQRGYNLTDKNPPYDIFTLSEDIASLIDACGGAPACVAGHDWGAAVAWTLAMVHPERVRRLAILNVPHPAVMMASIQKLNLRQLLKSWYIDFFQIPRLPESLLSRGDHAAMRRMLRSTALPGTFNARDLAHYEVAWSQPGALTATLGWYRSAFRLGFSARRAGLVKRVIPPTLILWGDRDVALEASLANESVEYCQQAQLIRYPQATHWVHQEIPEEINPRLVEHFQPTV